MKITDLRTVPLAMPLESPIGNATAQIAVFSYLAIYLDTDEGLTGLGESFRGAEAVEAVLQEQAPFDGATADGWLARLARLDDPAR